MIYSSVIIKSSHLLVIMPSNIVLFLHFYCLLHIYFSCIKAVYKHFSQKKLSIQHAIDLSDSIISYSADIYSYYFRNLEYKKMCFAHPRAFHFFYIKHIFCCAGHGCIATFPLRTRVHNFFLS